MCRPIADGVHFGVTFIKAVGEFNWQIVVSTPFTVSVIGIIVYTNVSVESNRYFF
jgi:hypothetical protein